MKNKIFTFFFISAFLMHVMPGFAQFFEANPTGSKQKYHPPVNLSEDDPFAQPGALEDFLSGFYRPDNKIVGGDAADIHDYPWQVSLQTLHGNHFCGGTIIHEEWILTASHCLDFPDLTPGLLRIRAGFTSHSSSEGTIHSVEKFIMHPQYNPATVANDIALIRLAQPIALNGQTRKKIPLVSYFDAQAGLTNAGVKARVSGWGVTSFESNSTTNVLRAVEVPIVEGSAGYGNIITPDMMLAGEPGKDACQGDSGGPLVVPDGMGGYKLAGVVSFGNQCGLENFPGVYARVSHFEEWIKQYVSLEDPNRYYTFYHEDFAAGQLPQGWETEVHEGPEGFKGWEWTLAGSLSEDKLNSSTSANGFMMVDSDAYGLNNTNEMADLITPPIDLSQVSTDVIFSLEHWAKTYQNADVSIWISNDDFNTGHMLYRWHDAPTNATNGSNPVLSRFNITQWAASEENVRFRFRWKGQWDYWWFIDDLKITVEDTFVDVDFHITDGHKPLQGAMVKTDFSGQESLTCENGVATLELYRANYTVYVAKAGYIPAQIQISVEEEAMKFDVQLEKIPVPEIQTSEESIAVTLPRNAQHHSQFTITNTGDADLHFSLTPAVAVSPQNKSQILTDEPEASPGYLHNQTPHAQHLPWSKMATYKTDTNESGAELGYDNGFMAYSIGLGQLAYWEAAIRLTPDELADYYGIYLLEKLMFFISDDSHSKVIAKIWEGGSDQGPGTVIYSEDVSSQIKEAGWFSHTLSQPIALVADKEYWIGYAITATGYPSGTDSGPMKPGKGAWMYYNNNWATLTQISASLNYNWGIRGQVKTIPPTWLAVSPQHNTLAPGESAEITLAYNPSAQQPGLYEAALIVNHNAGNPLRIPLQLNVTEPEYTLCFEVQDSKGNKIDEAEIVFDGGMVPEGEYCREGLTTGTYTWEVTAPGFYKASGNARIMDSDISLEVLLIEEDAGITELTVAVQDEFHQPVKGAFFNLQGFGGHFTDEEGKINISVIEGNFNYSLEKTGFENLSGILEVGEETSLTFTATLQYLRFDVTVTNPTAEGGSFSGAGSYHYRQMATLVATSAEGYHFTGWEENSIIISPEETYTFEVTENRDFMALFRLNTYIIKASSTDNGTISPAGDVEVEHSQDKTFTITPDHGFFIEDVKVDGQSAGALSTYTFTEVTAAAEIHAIFRANAYEITISTEGKGAVSPEGTLTVEHGDNLTLTLIPDEGYQVADIRIDGESKGSHTQFTLENITGNISVHVIFEITTSVDVTNPAIGLKLFPNPASRFFTLEAGKRISEVHIYSLSGQLLLSIPVHDYRKQIDISGLNSGTYLLQVIFNTEAKSLILHVQ